jgi:phage antirepressor YoqD-like protein
MDLIVSSIYFIIFVLMMVFVFSTGLLIPIIGKKNIIMVCIAGFIVGIVGGGFFMAPLYQDLPYLVGGVHSIIDSNHEFLTIFINSSRTDNINNTINTIKNMKGFKSLKSSEIKLITSKFSQERKNFIEKYLSSKNYSSYTIDNSDNDNSSIITIQTKKELDLNEVNIISKWLDYTGAVKTKAYYLYFNVNVNAFDINEDVNMLNDEHITTESITGTTQDSINFVKNIMVSKEYMILITGLIGLFVAIIGVFFDNILKIIKKFRK